jgi:hypothetical protein
MTAYLMMSEQQARELVRAHAAAVAAIVGVDAGQSEKLLKALPCENSEGEPADDGRFYVQGSWLMHCPSHAHATTLLRLHDAWLDQGFEIRKFQMFSENEGVLVAANPVDGVELLVESGVPPIAFAVLITSGCYRPR